MAETSTQRDPSTASIPAATNVGGGGGLGLRAEWEALVRLRGFWIGLALKLAFAALLGSEVATQNFSGILYQFSHETFRDPYNAMLQQGNPSAFPYGPVMLLWLAISWMPFAWLEFDPTGHFGLFLLRLPVLVVDIIICLILIRLMNMRATIVTRVYWLSAVPIYATYIHGQLDLVPTALLCLALYFVFERRFTASSIALGLGLATKLHLIIAIPFLVVHIYRKRRYRHLALRYLVVSCGLAALLYAVPVLSSPAFREMVFYSPESAKIWAARIDFAGGVPLFLAPTFLMMSVLTYSSYLKVNPQLTMMFLGSTFLGLMAVVPPQPGWFLWSFPFVAYLGAHYGRTRRIFVSVFVLAYLFFYMVSRPEEVLGALDVTLGPDFGITSAAWLQDNLPMLFGEKSVFMARALLFCTTVLTAVEMFRRGVASNALYRLRDRPFFIGIGGDSGSGKHTVGNDLQSLMGRQLTQMFGDDDHKWERGHPGWKDYTHLDPRANLLMNQYESLAGLYRGAYVRKSHYDHSVGQFTEPLEIGPNIFMAVIGLHTFYLPSQRALLDLKVYMDPPESVRREWKVRRDMAKRGYTRERVISQIEQRMPDGDKFLRPQIKHCDIVLRVLEPLELDSEGVAIEIEIATELASLHLVEAFDANPRLELEWNPGPDLRRDTIRLGGHASASEIAAMAEVLIPNLSSLIENEQWKVGVSGIIQLVVLHGVSARMLGVRGGSY